ncbi:cysteine hydrolase family protein [Rossellomorea marisflavi]|jgi:nicotinamidase-related amidase|uniref:cysteine hydrolase family protein n=1 Tax=Rossellomorea TaxID=2837508 RepID=UPI00064EF3B0|nr:isochorismatase family cysteine hydrolase [Rossellomorea marisflavi]KMK93121.1 isochorismatase [Rossellomorea marisflavi]TYO74399.1 cysteine hydrolase [Rossellomorea marisflavi]VXC42321.1 nicotinamidase; NAD salvage pathway [Bacillus sp. 349Y]
MKRALIVIDYTVDFVADEGKLTCGEPGQVIQGKIAGLMREFAEAGDYVVVANDIHFEGDEFHPETRLFPPHNIAGTEGRELYGAVRTAYDDVKASGASILEFDKTRYSAFAGTELDLRLRERGIREIHLVGVCTDICVLHTAVDGYNLGYSMVVHRDAVASFNQAGHEWALEHFKHTLGADVR